MNEGINLATPVAISQKKGNIYNTLSIVIVIGVILISAAFLGYVLFLKFNLNNLISQEEEEVKRLTAFAAIKTKTVTIRERLQAIKNILGGREDVNTNFNALTKTIPPGVEISQLTVSGKTMSIVFVSDSLAPLNTFLEGKMGTILQDKNVGVKKIDVSSFSLARGTKGYVTSLTIAFNK